MEYFGTVKKIFHKLFNKIGPKINIFKLLKTKREKKKYIEMLTEDMENVDRIVIWRSSFGWNVPLYQRPQHIARCLSNKRTRVLYEVTNETDSVTTMKKQKEN